MTKAKHTPGPWKSETARTFSQPDRHLVSSEKRVLCEAYSEPDARLIAAAPDLLKHLEDAAHWLKDLSLIARRGGNTELANHVTEQASRAYDAIAKARGEAV